MRWRCWAAPPPRPGCPAEPEQDRAALKAGGRKRNIEEKAQEIQAVLRAQQLAAPAAVTAAYGAATRATVNILLELTDQISAARDRAGPTF